MDVFEEGIRKDFEPMYERSRVGFERGKVGRVKVPAGELAAYNLYRVLEKYPEFTKEGRAKIQAEFADFPSLETMNLEVFASVLTFLRAHPQPTPDNFKDDNIVEYFSRLLPPKDMSGEEKKRLIIKLKALFLKYIVAIAAHRASIDLPEEEPEVNEEQYE